MKNWLTIIAVTMIIAGGAASYAYAQIPGLPDLTGADAGDQPYVEKIYRGLTKKCWACGTVGHFYDLATYFGLGISSFISETFKSFVLIIFAIWLMFQVGQLLLPFGADSRLSNIAVGIGKRSMILLVVFVFLQSPYLIWEWAIDPFLTTGVQLSEKIQNELMEDAKSVKPVSGNAAEDIFSVVSAFFSSSSLTGFFSTILNMTSDNESCKQAVDDYEGIGTKYSVSRITVNSGDNGAALKENAINNRNSLMRQVCMLQMKMGIGLAAGHAAMKSAGYVQGAEFEQNDPFYAGMILFAVYALILLVYPLFLIEALFKIAVVAIFSPLFIAGLLIPSLQKYSISAFKIIIQSILTIVFLSAISGIGVILLNNATATFGYANPLDFLARMGEALLGIHRQSEISLTSAYFWTFLIIGLITLLMITRSSSTAAAIVGGQDTGAAGQASGMMMSAATMASGRVGGGVAAGGGAGGISSGGGYFDMIKQRLGRATFN